jgi:hypothetical protein
MSTVFLLSPARCSGDRARMLASSTKSAMARQLRTEGAAIGEVFSWLSALYFRGKLAYARAFDRRGVFVMAPGLGLVEPDTKIVSEQLSRMGEVDIESESFVRPLLRDAAALERRLDRQHGKQSRAVLLGSIATGKYVDTLLSVFGERLVFPEMFVGRGDMSRGGLLLRAARSGDELAYIPIAGAVRHGRRPPKLPKLPRLVQRPRSP